MKQCFETRTNDGHLGSRRGPVNDRATTRIDGVQCERKRASSGAVGREGAGQTTGPSNLAKVGVAGSNPVVRSAEGPLSRGPSRIARAGRKVVGRVFTGVDQEFDGSGHNPAAYGFSGIDGIGSATESAHRLARPSAPFVGDGTRL